MRRIGDDSCAQMSTCNVDEAEQTTNRAVAEQTDGDMNKVYFLTRLLEAMALAEQAETEQERAVHRRTLRHYRELIDAERSQPH
jgi:hypothetical protein